MNKKVFISKLIFYWYFDILNSYYLLDLKHFKHFILHKVHKVFQYDLVGEQQFKFRRFKIVNF